MKCLVTTLILGFLFIGGISAQKTAPKFSSIYTDLDKSCKTIRGGDGQDDAFDCRGVGGYRIYNWSAAAAQFFAVKTSKKNEEMTQLGSQSFDFDMGKAKVEWRLANGKPFAVIIRFNKYADPDEANPYFGKKIGTELIVKGLKGFDKIDFTVDAKTPNANAKAREMADTAYKQK